MRISFIISCLKASHSAAVTQPPSPPFTCFRMVSSLAEPKRFRTERGDCAGGCPADSGVAVVPLQAAGRRCGRVALRSQVFSGVDVTELSVDDSSALSRCALRRARVLAISFIMQCRVPRAPPLPADDEEDPECSPPLGDAASVVVGVVCCLACLLSLACCNCAARPVRSGCGGGGGGGGGAGPGAPGGGGGGGGPALGAGAGC